MDKFVILFQEQQSDGDLVDFDVDDDNRTDDKLRLVSFTQQDNQARVQHRNTFKHYQNNNYNKQYIYFHRMSISIMTSDIQTQQE